MFSVQVDSGYNTHSVCTTSLMDTLNSDNQSREMLDMHTAEEGLPYARHTKPKVTHNYILNTSYWLLFVSSLRVSDLMRFLCPCGVFYI